jgi:hypothetical protein
MRLTIKLNCQFTALTGDINSHKRHIRKITTTEPLSQRH